MSGRLLFGGTENHYCPVPGRRHRKKLGVKPGSIWQCTEDIEAPVQVAGIPREVETVVCGRLWEWAYDGWDSRNYWSRYYPKPPIPQRAAGSPTTKEAT